VIEAPYFKKLLGDISDKDVLDLGCGEGHFTRIISENTTGKVYGMDLSKEMIQLAESQLIEGKKHHIHCWRC